MRNSLEYEKVRDYVTNLVFVIFGISNFDFVNFKDTIALHLKTSKDLNLYLFLDKENIELLLSNQNQIIKKFKNDSCWYQGLKFVFENYF